MDELYEVVWIMPKTPYYSYKLKTLPKGCQYCIKGSKLVLFITGLCPRSCYFCPISDQKYKKDVIYADEWKVDNIKQTIQEAKLIDAKGAGITGGDPLCRLQRTIAYIKTLKKTFTKSFHIHLYTSLDLINSTTLKKLYNAGLDEIRFHLDIDNPKLWNKLTLPLNFDWDVGIEIPVIPGKYSKYIKILNFIKNANNLKLKNKDLKNNKSNKIKTKIKFLNLNELEIADNKVNKLTAQGFKPKNNLSYAVKGSEQLALRLLKYIDKNNLNIKVHYCTATLKDKVQLANRIKRRAKNIKQPYDILTEDNTLIRGAIYLEELKPDIGYRRKLNSIKNKTAILKKLTKIKSELKKDFKIKDNQITLDKTKLRILTSTKIINNIKEKINKEILKNHLKDKKILFSKKPLYLAIVEEYPTQDQLELSVEFL